MKVVLWSVVVLAALFTAEVVYTAFARKGLVRSSARHGAAGEPRTGPVPPHETPGAPSPVVKRAFTVDSPMADTGESTGAAQPGPFRAPNRGAERPPAPADG